MTAENLIKELERYRKELTQIMTRFTHSGDGMFRGFHMDRDDDPRLRTIVIELLDLLNDSIPDNRYAHLIQHTYNSGYSEFFLSYSYKCVEDIVAILDSIITRLKRNPDICSAKKAPLQPHTAVKIADKAQGNIFKDCTIAGSVIIDQQAKDNQFDNTDISMPTSSEKKWYEKPLGYIFLTVIATLIAGYLIYHLGWNGPKETKPQATQEQKGSAIPAKKTILHSDFVVKEYIFGNQYFYLQVLADSSGRVLAYGVTTRKADFNPAFKILKHAFTPSKVSPENLKKAIPLVFTITLGKTHFGDFPHSPENIFAYLGARRLYYHEEYYFGNPGEYQSYFVGVNDSGFVNINNDSLNFFNENRINPDDKSVANFRASSTINTFFVTFPMGGFETALRKYLIGPDLDQVRVISDAALITEEPRYSLLNKMKSLSTEVNIQIYINLFGHPLIINDHPHLEIRNDITLGERLP